MFVHSSSRFVDQVFSNLIGSSLKPTLFVFLALAFAQNAWSADLSGAEIVAKADNIRFPQEGFQVLIKVSSVEDGGGDEDRLTYQVLSKGNDRTVVLTREPPSERGQMLLMRDKDLWVFLPNISQPVRLPLSQRLTGQVANGDLARANFKGDYDATVTGEEACEDNTCYVLDLTAARKGVTYSKVKYWVRKDNYYPHRAEFYSKSEKLLKSAMYSEFKELGGSIRPTRLTLTDALKGGVSVMDYSKMKKRKLADKIFTKQYLQKLQ